MNNREAFESLMRKTFGEKTNLNRMMTITGERSGEYRQPSVNACWMMFSALASQEPTLKNNEFIPDSTEGRIQAAIKCLNMHWVSHDANRFDYAIEGLEKCLAGLASQAKRMEELEAATEHLEPENPLDMPLPCDIRIGAGTIKKGSKLSVLVRRMNVLYQLAMKTQLGIGEPANQEPTKDER